MHATGRCESPQLERDADTQGQRRWGSHDMTASADGDIRLAQATPPAAGPQAPAAETARRRVTFAPGVRRVIDLQPGETVEMVAQPNELTYRRTAEGLLVVSSAGGEVLLRGADAQGSTSTVVVGDVARPVLDLFAAALQDVTPAAGQPGGPPAPTGPIAQGSGLGAFGNLIVNPLIGLVDTGPLGFSGLRRTAPEPEFRSLRPDGGGGDGAGALGAGGGGGGPLPFSPDIALVARGASALETNAPVTLGLGLGVTIIDTDGPPAETLLRLTIVFAETPPPGTLVSAGTLSGNVLILDIADFADAAALEAAIAGLAITLPADWAGVLNATAQATTSEGVSATEVFALTVTPTGDIDATGTSATAAETNAPVTLAVPVNAVISDANGQAPETLERVEITFIGLPAGTSFSAGALVGDVLTLDVATLGSPAALAAALAALQVTVPADWSGVVPATIVAFSTEGSSVAAPFTITVTPTPDVSATGTDVAASQSPAPLTLAIPISTTITDTSVGAPELLQSVSITFTGLPPGTVFSAGTLAGNVLTVSVGSFGGDAAALQAALAALTITLPASFIGTIGAAIVPTSNEGTGSASSFDIGVAPVPAPAPTIAATPAETLEDLPGGPLALAATLTPASGATSSWVVISGIPAGVSFNTGTPAGPGAIRVEAAALATLSLTGLPANSDADLALTLTPFSEVAGVSVAGTPVALPIVVDAVADTPNLSAPAALSVAEGAGIALAITSSLVDGDGSETLSLELGGVPAGSILTSGGVTLTPGAGGIYTLTPAQLADLTLTPPAGSAGDVVLSVSATARETTLSGGEPDLSNNTATRSTTIALTITPGLGLAPTIAATPAETLEDLPGGPLALAATLTPASGATSSWVVISGIPAGVSFNTGTPAGPGAIRVEAAALASLSLLTLPANSDADLALTLTPFSEVAGVSVPGTPVALPIVVDAVADQPNLSAPAALSVAEGAGIALAITSSLVDGDGSETLSLELGGVPAGSVLTSGGVTLTPGAGGIYTLTPAQLADLTLTPPAGSAGDVVLSVSATARETTLSGGEPDLSNNTATRSTTIALTITPGLGLAPTIAATPAETLEDLPGGPLALAATLTPASGATSSWVVISGIPAGVSFNTGTPAGPGAIRVEAAALATLSLTGLPANSDADLALTLTPFSEVAGVSVAGTPVALPIVVDAVADTPNLSAPAALSVAEGAGIALAITSSLVDGDGSETLSLELGGVPAGSVLTSGGVTLTPGAGGIYTLTPAQLADLTLTPPAGSAGDVVLSVSATARETTLSGGEPDLSNNTATRSTTIALTITPGLGLAPTIAATPAETLEDLPGGPLALAATLTPASGATSSWVVISGIPAGVSFNTGTPAGPGAIRVEAAALATLSLTGLPANSDADLALTLTPFSEVAGVSVAGTPVALPIVVDAVADTPLLTATAVSGIEDAPVALSIFAAPADTDGSETLTGITIGGVPADAQLVSGGTTLVPIGGVYTLTPAQLSALSLRPAANASGEVTLSITAGVTDTPSDSGELTTANNFASATTTLVVTIAPLSDVPSLTVPVGVAIKEDLGAGTIATAPPALGAAALAIVVTPGAPGESAFVDVSGIPAGVAFNVAGTSVAPGVVRFTAAEAAALRIVALPADSDADLRLTVTPLSVDGGAVPAFGPPQIVTVAVDAVADLPIIGRAGGSGLEDSAIALRLTNALADTDGSETLDAVRLTGVPADAVLTYVAGGATLTLAPTASAGGFSVYDLDSTQAASASLRPPADFRGTIVLGATLTARESALSGDELNLVDNLATATGGLTIEVLPSSDEPGLVLSVRDVALREDLGVDRPGSPLVPDGGRAIGAAVTPGAAGETAFVVISGIPAGVTFNAPGLATTLVTGGRLFTAAEALALSITGLPNDSDDDFALTLTPFSQDGLATPRAGTAATIAVTVDAVADRPDFSGAVVGTEDSAIALNLSARLGDLDGSEVLQGVTIGGLPSDFTLATIAGGVTTALTAFGGDYFVGEAQIPFLHVIAPRDRNGDVTLSLVVEVREQVSGPGEIFFGDNKATETGTLVLSVTPVSDTPGLTVPLLVVGKEDLGAPSPGAGTPGTSGGFATGGVPSGPIALPIIATPGAPGETASVIISGIPAGVGFNAGVVGGDGRLTLTPTEAASLSITALPSDLGGDVALTVNALSRDAGGVPASSVSQIVTLRLDPVADVPQLSLTSIAVDEDAVVAGNTQRIALSIAAMPADRDGSEVLTLAITGVPTGMSLSAGSFDSATGTWLVSQAAIAGLQLIAPLHAAASFTLGVTAIARETAADSDPADNVATRFALLPVTIAAVADAPTLVVGGKAKGFEDSFIPLAISSALVDTDGSETLAIRLDGVPVGSVLRSGPTTLVPAGSGGGGDSYVLTPAQLAGLAVRPPPDSNVDFTLGVTATATEASNGSTAQRVAAITVDVVGVSDGATLVGSGASPEDRVDAAGGRVPLNIVAGILDSDAAAGRPVSETVTAIVIAGVPAGYALSHGLVTGIAPDGSTSWTLKKLDVGNEWDVVELLGWPTHVAGTLDLRATVVTTENDGDTEATAFALPVVVTPVVDDFVPSGGGIGDEDTRIALTISPGLIDRDGSERVLGPVTISGIPSDAVIRSGDRVLVPTIDAGGLLTYVVSEPDLAALSIQPARDSNRDFTLSATMTISEFDAGGAPVPGQSRTESFDMPVTVIGVADTPDVFAVALTGEAGADFGTTLGATLADTDGSERAYFIVSGTREGMGLDLSDGAPGNAVLRALGDGQWLVDAAAIGFIRIRTMESFADGGTTVVPLTLTAVAEENDGIRDREAVAQIFDVTITPSLESSSDERGEPGVPGEPPTLGVLPTISGVEDQPVPLVLSITGVPADAQVTVIISRSSLPAGARITTASPDAIFVDPATGDVIVLAEPAVLATLALVPPANFSGIFNPTITATANYQDGSIGRATVSPTVAIAPIADPASAAAIGAGVEDSLVKLSLAATVTDTDGSERIDSLRIADVSDGAVLTNAAGIELPSSDGVYSVANPDDVYWRAAPHAHGTQSFSLLVTTTDLAAGLPPSSTVTTIAGSVSIAAVADAATIAGPPVLAGIEDLGAALGGPGRIVITPVDVDGSEALSVVVQVLATPTGVLPTEVRLDAGIDNGDGTWTLTNAEFAGASLLLPEGRAGDVAIRVVANTIERSNADTAFVEHLATVSIAAAADTPTLAVSAATGAEDGAIALAIVADLGDTDGSETLAITIGNLPGGASLSAGVDNGDGSWSLLPDDLDGLVFNPPADAFGIFDLEVTARATEIGGGTPAEASVSATLRVEVVDVVDTFLGTSGPDLLIGTDGADVIEGRGGADTLAGGAGSDRFAYGGDALDAADVITDFDAGDRLDLGALLTTLGGTPGTADDFISIVQSGTSTEIRVDQNGAFAGDTDTLLATIQNQAAAQVRSQTDFA
jgi:large repetitive protein